MATPRCRPGCTASSSTPASTSSGAAALVVSLDGPEPVDPHDDVLRTDVRLDVQAALARLPEHHRAALVLVDMHAVPVAEAAQILGVPVGTVKSRCARGRAALAEILGMTPRARNRDPAATSHR